MCFVRNLPKVHSRSIRSLVGARGRAVSVTMAVVYGNSPREYDLAVTGANAAKQVKDGQAALAFLSLIRRTTLSVL